jgi:hypothetical protein
VFPFRVAVMDTPYPIAGQKLLEERPPDFPIDSWDLGDHLLGKSGI